MKLKQKTTKPTIVVTIIVAAIIATLIIAILIGNSFVNRRYGNYQIPTGYTHVIRNDKTATDGPDITYYIYPDKVICETKSYLPVDESRNYTKTRTVVVYEGAASVEDVTGKTGKEIANEHD